MTKQRVNILVEEKILEKWDKLADQIGMNRTAMIHNAVRTYDSIIQNQLTRDQEEIVKQKLDRIEGLIESLNMKKESLLEEEDSLEQQVISDTSEIHDFDIVSKRILDLLASYGALRDSAIANHLEYPKWLVWIVLKKLKGAKKVRINQGEWSLYE